MQTVTEAFAETSAPRRATTLSLGAFALFALALAAVGIYGVVSYAVASRTREIGLRMALGAGSARVRRLVVRQALVPVAAGSLAGLAGSIRRRPFAGNDAPGSSELLRASHVQA